jgi:nitrogen fixation/metabolism regulation signal transduction histidine kinase
MAEHKRELKNFIVNKQFQTRMSYYFVALSIGLVGLMLVFMNTHINELRVEMANIANLPMVSQLQIDATLNQLIMTALGFLLLSIIGAVVYGIIISHRIAGPMFAILKYIEKLRAGQYDDYRKLRPYDELQPIMESLHELAEDLKKRSR